MQRLGAHAPKADSLSDDESSIEQTLRRPPWRFKHLTQHKHVTRAGFFAAKQLSFLLWWLF